MRLCSVPEVPGPAFGFLFVEKLRLGTGATSLKPTGNLFPFLGPAVKAWPHAIGGFPEIPIFFFFCKGVIEATFGTAVNRVVMVLVLCCR